MKLLEVKLLYAKVLYVKFVCVWSYCMLSVRVWGRRREEEAAPGIQNQKQEPHTKMWGKTQCFATFLPFRAPGSSFFWDFLFFDIIFSSLLFSDSSHLCFWFVHIVGSLTSKLPSIICSPPNLSYTIVERTWSTSSKLRMDVTFRWTHEAILSTSINY